jgi:hypothetical protein
MIYPCIVSISTQPYGRMSAIRGLLRNPSMQVFASLFKIFPYQRNAMRSRFLILVLKLFF